MITLGPPHHISYAVADLDRAIHRAAETVGAGPFFVLRDVPLTATSGGEPAEFLHSSAFGQWGAVRLEFQQIEHCAPDHVAAAMGSVTPTMNHIGWAVPSLDSAAEALDQAGIPQFLRANIGDIDFTIHDARELYGHNVELHADSDGFRAFFEQVLNASIDWDGQDPIRTPSM